MQPLQDLLHRMLDRDVAITIQSEAFAHDTERLARFQREAKTLVSLNHPNIAIVHGLEQAGDVHALVMELVDGADLTQSRRVCSVCGGLFPGKARTKRGCPGCRYAALRPPARPAQAWHAPCFGNGVSQRKETPMAAYFVAFFAASFAAASGLALIYAVNHLDPPQSRS